MGLQAVLSVARHLLFFALVIVCVYTDLTRQRLYNWCTLPALAAGLLVNYALGGVLEGGLLGVNLTSSMVGLLAAALVFAWPYLRGGIAGGDVKLMLAVAAIGGAQNLFIAYALLYSALIGGLMALLVLIWRGKLWEGLRGAVRFTFSTGRVGSGEGAASPSTSGVAVPYGFAISIGSVIAWYVTVLPRVGTAMGLITAP
jgi:prepilin peptidase CpaA